MTTRRAARRRSPSPRRATRGRVRRIVTLGSPDDAVLRRRSRSVGAVNAPIRALIADLVVTMRRARGVGLAAPQVGVPLRVLVADSASGPVALVNPRLRRRRGSQIGPEGCLSIPGVFGNVRRARVVDVDGRDARGRRVVVRGADLFARVLQHEIDHLNGVLFTDRVSGALLRRRNGSRPLRAAASGPRLIRRRSPRHDRARKRRVRRT